MHTTHIWHKFNIYRYQVVLCVLLFILGTPLCSIAQHSGTLNLPYFDEQKVHFGFMLCMHSAGFQLTYDDSFADVTLDEIHSILPINSLGFKIGFISDFHIIDVLDLRLGLNTSFNQLKLDYRYTDNTSFIELIDPTYVELPILFKYKSVRRDNHRMYFLAGINPSLRASGSKEKEDQSDHILLKRYNVSLDIGAGFDLYKELFKFSPEIKYSFGLTNVLSDQPNLLSRGIDRLTIHTLSFCITFEGSPTNKAKKKKRW